MCRLLGVVSSAPISVADAVGDGVLKDFVALTKVHGDGWGVGVIDTGFIDTGFIDTAFMDGAAAAPHVHVSAGSALDDPDFATATQDSAAVGSIVHLRWATNGLAVEPQNSHPFLTDGLAMAHNGSIKPMSLLDAL